MADIKSALTINTSQFQAAISQSTTAVSGLGAKIVSAGQVGAEAFNKLASAAEVVTSKMNSVGGAIVGAGLISFAHSAAESVSQMVDLANSIGVTTQSMMEMNLAAVAAGSSGEEVAKMIQKMNMAALDASDGNTKLRSEMEALGVTQDYLKTHSPEEAFKKMAESLGNITDVSKRATLGMDLFGKTGSKQVWKDLSEGMDKYAGTQKDAAAATESAKKVMDELAVGAENVKNQFILLLSPVTDLIAPMIDGLGGARVAAVALAGAMGLFASSSIISAINAVIKGIDGLTGSTTKAIQASVAEATVIEKSNESKLRAVAIDAAGANAKSKSLDVSIKALKATIAATDSEEIAARAKKELTNLEWRKSVATAAAAEANASYGAAKRMATAADNAGIVSSGGVIASQTAMTWSVAGLSASMKGLAVSTAAALIPMAGFALIASSVVAVFQMVKSLASGGRGDNFINDYFEETLGIDAKTVNEKSDNIRRIASLSDTQKAAYDKMNDNDKKALLDAMKMNEEAKKAEEIRSVLDPAKKTVVDNSAIDALKAQGATQKLNNDLAKEKLELDIKSLSMTQAEAQAATNHLEAQSQIRQNNLRAQQEIAKLEEQANATGLDTEKRDSLIAQTGEVKKQLELSNQQVTALEKQKNAVNASKQARKDEIAVQELGLKISQEEADMRTQIGLIGATNEQKALADIQKRVDAEVQGQIKIAMAKNGDRPITKAEEEKIRANVTPKYEEEKQLAVSLQKANDAESIRLAYMSTEQKIAESIRTMQHDADELTMTNDQIKLNNIERRIDAEVEGIVRIREAQNGNKPIAQSEVDAIRAELEPKFAAETLASKALIAKSREFATGFKKSWNDYADQATNAAERGKEVFSAMQTAAETAMDKILGDSDATWSQIFNNAVKQLVKSDLKNVLGNLMNSASGSSSGGGIFQSLGRMFAGGFAGGGYIPANSYGITGESGPEVVNGPATITPMTSGDTYHVTINANDAKSFVQMMSEHPEVIYGLSLKGQRSLGA